MINWQLSKQGIHRPVSLDRIAGSGVDPSRSVIFLKLSADKLLVFKWSQAQGWFFFSFMWNVISSWAAQLKFWFKTDLGSENSNSYYRQGRQLLLTLLTMVTRWSRSTSIFYALIGQNLTGELMRKIYATPWILFTWTAEADRVLCQLVMFLTVFFHWMHEMKFSCYRESSVIHGKLVFGWEINTSLVIVGNPISEGIVFVFHLAWCVKVWSDTGLTWYLSGAASRMVSLSNYCVWCLFFISNLMKSSVVYAAM